MTADAVVVIDSSVFVAIFKNEAEADRLVERASSYERRLTSAATWLESAIVCERAAKRNGGDRFKRIAKSLNVEVVPFTAEQARVAFEAFRRFGKGLGSKASLNYGDCFVYALAKELKAPVLFKGNDFAQTDIHSA
jgi:ribonuclease VapC